MNLFMYLQVIERSIRKREGEEGGKKGRQNIKEKKIRIISKGLPNV